MTKNTELREYRSQQAKLAIYRDDGLCVICYFLYKRIRKSHHVHHIYGRSRQPDWREKYTSLMSVCVECHPQPIIQKPASPYLSWVEDIAERMNTTPINKEFIYDG